MATPDPFYRGPLVVVTGQVAARLSRPLVGLLRQARDRGERLDDELVATVSAIERAGREYAASRVRAGSASGTAELDSAELPSGSGVDGLSTAKAAAQLRCSERWVTKLIASRRLEAQRVGRAWLVDAASLANLIEDR
jgi:excisionase family DNA binding protein